MAAPRRRCSNGRAIARPIESLEDPRIADYRNLKDGDLRHARRRFIAEGRGVVRCLLSESRFPTRSIFSTPTALRALGDVLGRSLDYPVYVAEPSLFSEIIGFSFHRGCLAAGGRVPAEGAWSFADLEKGRTGVVMEGLTDPDNVGSVFRNARAFGVAGVLLCPRCCDPLYRKAIRTSLGASLCLPFERSRSLEASLAAARKRVRSSAVSAARRSWEIAGPSPANFWYYKWCEDGSASLRGDLWGWET